jgi:hypothetical protein
MTIDPRKWKRSTASAASALAGVAVAIGGVAALNATDVIGKHEQSAQDPTEARTLDALTDSPMVSKGPGIPCESATHVKDLSQVTTNHVYWPARGSLTDAWTCIEGSTPILMYGKVQVSFADGTDGVDPQKYFTQLASVNGGEVTRIQGRPAWVGQGNEKGDYSHALMIVGDTTVTLLAQSDVPLDDVLKVADELEIPAFG